MTIIVTGGIGSGKSAVCSIFREHYGLPVYEADLKVKELYDSDSTLLDSIEDVVGRRLRDGDGRLDRARLAEVIFSDRNALEKVEELVFPALKRDFAAWADDHSGSPHHLFESATVLEKRQFDGFGDLVLLVDAPYSLRLERACGRDSSDREAVMKRMGNQPLMNRLSEGFRDERIDYVIDNSGSFVELKAKVEEFMKKYDLT